MFSLSFSYFLGRTLGYSVFPLIGFKRTIFRKMLQRVFRAILAYDHQVSMCSKDVMLGGAAKVFSHEHHTMYVFRGCLPDRGLCSQSTRDALWLTPHEAQKSGITSGLQKAQGVPSSMKQKPYTESGLTKVQLCSLVGSIGPQRLEETRTELSLSPSLSLSFSFFLSFFLSVSLSLSLRALRNLVPCCLIS